MTHKVANAPLFRDPVYDGAADPVVVYNRQEQQWWMFYTNRRATDPLPGLTWIHGTDIGVASSPDGSDWTYRGTVDLEHGWGRNTYWAPEIFWAQGQYHMYVSYIEGVPTRWAGHTRTIRHFTSANLKDWVYQGPLNLESGQVIDACVMPAAASLRAAGQPVAADTPRYLMWFKDEAENSRTYVAASEDLFTWKRLGLAIGGAPHEGANVFRLGGFFWLIVDEWRGQRAYRSNNLMDWEKRTLILDQPGTRPDDGSIGLHADVIVPGDHALDAYATSRSIDGTGPVEPELAYIFYFTHPGTSQMITDRDSHEARRTSVQVAELRVQDGDLVAERNDVRINLNVV